VLILVAASHGAAHRAAAKCLDETHISNDLLSTSSKHRLLRLQTRRPRSEHLDAIVRTALETKRRQIAHNLRLSLGGRLTDLRTDPPAPAVCAKDADENFKLVHT
jgi:hypothetical protein